MHKIFTTKENNKSIMFYSQQQDFLNAIDKIIKSLDKNQYSAGRSTLDTDTKNLISKLPVNFICYRDAWGDNQKLLVGALQALQYSINNKSMQYFDFKGDLVFIKKTLSEAPDSWDFSEKLNVKFWNYMTCNYAEKKHEFTISNLNLITRKDPKSMSNQCYQEYKQTHNSYWYSMGDKYKLISTMYDSLNNMQSLGYASGQVLSSGMRKAFKDIKWNFKFNKAELEKYNKDNIIGYSSKVLAQKLSVMQKLSQGNELFVTYWNILNDAVYIMKALTNTIGQDDVWSINNNDDKNAFSNIEQYAHNDWDLTN